MRAYVLGAGASFPIYPLGGKLLEAIDEYVKSQGNLVNRFDYHNDWPRLKGWLEDNPNPLLRQAFKNGNIEQIFTVLDLAKLLFPHSQISTFQDKEGIERDVRRTLLWAMEGYFLNRNQFDQGNYNSSDWNVLRRFGRLLKPGDIVITFNYDSTIERVLFDQKKWTPNDGYGTDLVFQKSRSDKTRVDFPPSAVKVLHLHGAIGWFDKPFNPDFNLAHGGFTPSSEDIAPGWIKKEIALDPLFLQGLGIYNVDAALPSRPPDESQILLHPSSLKTYGGEDRPSQIFSNLWRTALDALRGAEEVTIIGYSLPPEDSAAWTLLHTGCKRERTTIVNPDKSVLRNHYSGLSTPSAPAMDFGTWLDSQSAAVNELID